MKYHPSSITAATYNDKVTSILRRYCITPSAPNIKDELTPPYFSVVGIVLLSFVVLANIADAASLRLAGLKEIHNDAKYIFLGKCTKNRVELEQQTGYIVTHSTFKVLDSIKGNLIKHSNHTIKQIGGTLPNGKSFYIENVPTFKLNEQYFLFIPKKSSQGFSSPVALSQGQFSVIVKGDDKAVSNGKEFSKLLKDVPKNKLTEKAKGKKDKKAKTPKEKKKNSRMKLDEFTKLLKKMKTSKDNGSPDDDDDGDNDNGSDHDD